MQYSGDANTAVQVCKTNENPEFPLFERKHSTRLWKSAKYTVGKIALIMGR